MILSIASRGHIKQNPPLPFLVPSRVGELQPKLRFSDPGRPHHDCQCPWNQTTPEHLIQGGNSR